MTVATCECYYLPTKTVVGLAKAPIGKLTPVLTLEDAATPITLLDCFDQPLRNSDRLLFKLGDRVDLLTPNGQIISQPTPTKVQFIAGLPNGPVKSALADISPLRSLLPIGSGTLRRGVLTLLDDEEKTHCRAHLRLFTCSGGKRMALVNLQGIRGYAKSHAALRQHIEACGGIPLNIAGLSAEILPRQKAYTARPEISINADQTAFTTATNIIAGYIAVAEGNEAGIIADHDTEFLHDYRIALRKIRSVLSLFKGVYAEEQTAELKSRFADLMAATGRLRDLDVYLLEKQRYYDFLPKALHGGLDQIFAVFTKDRKVEHAKLAEILKSKGYIKEMSGLTKLFEKRKKLHSGPSANRGAHEFACTLIWKRYRTICKSAAHIRPETDDAEVHALRIHCKKLRYLMEFFASLFPTPAFKALLKPLKLLQDNLGLFNDFGVQQASLQDFLHKADRWPNGPNLEIAQTVGALTAVLHRRQSEERAKVVENFAQFNSTTMQTAFCDLFHAGKT
jgi:CHAD domain-containing protein